MVSITTETILFNFNPIQDGGRGGGNWGYDNFTHKNARVSKLWSHDHIYSVI